MEPWQEVMKTRERQDGQQQSRGKIVSISHSKVVIGISGFMHLSLIYFGAVTFLHVSSDSSSQHLPTNLTHTVDETAGKSSQ